MTEHQIQKAFFSWLKYKMPEVYELTFAIPNGGHRNDSVGRKLKEEGVKPGVPDIFIAVPRKGFCGLFIEVKTEKGRLRELQSVWMAKLGRAGYVSVLCRGLDDIIDTVDAYFKQEKCPPESAFTAEELRAAEKGTEEKTIITLKSGR